MVTDVDWRNGSSTTRLAHYERSVAGAPRFRTGYKQRRDWTYDALARPTYDRIWLTNTGRTLAERSYGYLGDDVSEVWGYNDGLVADASYRYDAHHRLERADGPLGYVADLRYTSSGNIDHATIFGALDAPDRNVTYRYGAFDPQAVDTLVDPLGDQTMWMEYDLAGNLTKRTAEDGTELNLTWDGANLLREARGPNGTESYLFGPGAERIVAVGADTVTLWFGESQTHYSRSGSLKVRYHHIAAGEPIARIEGGRKAELQYADALANLMLAADPKGNVLASFLYGAFGELVAQSGERNHRRQFNSKEHDATSGLRHYGYRSYDPMLLRWVSADPLYRFAPDSAWTEPQRANLYAFSLNNPLRYLDPDGRNPKPPPFNDNGGHHYVPRSVIEQLQRIQGLSNEAAAVFYKNVTGWPDSPHIDNHPFNKTHGFYNTRVHMAFAEFVVDEGVDVKNMTAAEAQRFVDRIKASNDPILHGFLAPHEKVVKDYKAGKDPKKIGDRYRVVMKSMEAGGRTAAWFGRNMGKHSGKLLGVGGWGLEVLDLYKDYREWKAGKIEVWWSEYGQNWTTTPPDWDSIRDLSTPRTWMYPEVYEAQKCNWRTCI
jgi:RHS repeat-associated protein